MDAKHWNGDDNREQFCSGEWRVCPCPDCEDYRENDRYLNGDQEPAEAPDFAAVQDAARGVK